MTNGKSEIKNTQKLINFAVVHDLNQSQWQEQKKNNLTLFDRMKKKKFSLSSQLIHRWMSITIRLLIIAIVFMNRTNQIDNKLSDFN